MKPKFQLKYREGYKYQVYQEFTDYIDIKGFDIRHSFIRLLSNGTIHIKAGYAWDGPSGPSIDTDSFMRGSLIHDALYQLIREKYIPYSYKDKSDRELVRMCREDGMTWFRAWYVYKALKYFGKTAATRSRAVLKVPKQ